MKIAVECKSPLLQKSLEMFLSRHLSTIKHCDIVIRDEKYLDDDRCFYISTSKEADLIKPFSKSQLILALENRYNTTHLQKAQNEPLDFNILEKRIEYLTQEYQNNIIKAVRAFYEK